MDRAIKSIFHVLKGVLMAVLKSTEIGRRLRQFRLNAGLTQEELAVRIDVTFQQVQKYESGTTRLNSDKLQQVADALQIPASALVDGAVKSDFVLSEPEQKIVELYRAIKDTKTREALVKFLSGVIK